MDKLDIEWLADLLEKSNWLFYGEFDDYLNTFLKRAFQKEPKDFGFDESLPNDFQVAYWSVISELNALNLIDYGTSPRGAWLTDDGKRFKALVLDRENAIAEATKVTHYRYNPDDR